MIPMWHEWNVNADDVMMTWFTLYVIPCDITLGMHNMHVHAWHSAQQI